MFLDGIFVPKLKSRHYNIVYQEHDGEACPEEQRKEYDDAWALIVKAHETLTDETSWRNWLETGNPDGRLQTTWGIALPAKVSKFSEIIREGIKDKTFCVWKRFSYA